MTSGISSNGGGKLHDMTVLPADDTIGVGDCITSDDAPCGGMEQAITRLSGVAAFTIARLAG